MLITKEVKIKWTNNRKIYEPKGYKFTKKNDIFIVKIEDLALNSRAQVEIKCDYCGKEFFKEYSVYNIQKENSFLKKDCCGDCKHLKIKETNLTKYGCLDSKQINIDINEIKLQFKNRNMELITNTYINSKSKLEYICLNHTDKGIQRISYSKFKSGQGCKYCGFDKNAELSRYNYNDVKKDFESHNYTLLENEYSNNRLPLKYICNIHKDKGIQTIAYGTLKAGHGCFYCGREIIEKARRLDFNFIKSEFEKHNYTLLETEYINNSTNMRYICKEHPEIIQEIDYNHLSRGQGCKMCFSYLCEKFISSYLINRRINFSMQYKFTDCRNILPLPFDFAIFEDKEKTRLKMLIEYDGEQHYRPVNFGGISDERALIKFNQTQINDEIKNNYCKVNNIKLLRIPYWDSDKIEEILDEILRM
jgi:hypothetical protein